MIKTIKARTIMMTVLKLFILLAIITASDTVMAEYGDIIMDRNKSSLEKAKVKPATFPHWFHRIRCKCKVCHEDIFLMEKGANDVNMKAIMNGLFCGKCHDGRIAWEPIYCDKCHL